MGTSYIYKRDASRLFIAMRENGKRYKIYIPNESRPVIDGIEQDIDFVEQEDFHYAFDWKGKRFHVAFVLELALPIGRHTVAFFIYML